MLDRDWQSCTDLLHMLEFLEQQGRLTSRLLQYLVCGCCRQVEDHVRPLLRSMLDVTEQIVECPLHLRTEFHPLCSRHYDLFLQLYRDRLEELENEVCSLTFWVHAGMQCGSKGATLLRALCPPATPARQADVLRELAGPVDPITLPSGWQHWQAGFIPALAREIAATAAFEHLPILADALLDAGCDSPPLIDHLQRPTGHLRGCWALEILAPGWRS